ncbi:hypothetical protein [Lonsdalea quercina]|uniref:hypothetical protein n=1 Tax=Lonsdalea quercina TaxID=71657 RepID=UPI0039751674
MENIFFAWWPREAFLVSSASIGFSLPFSGSLCEEKITGGDYFQDLVYHLEIRVIHYRLVSHDIALLVALGLDIIRF